MLFLLKSPDLRTPWGNPPLVVRGPLSLVGIQPPRGLIPVEVIQVDLPAQVPLSLKEGNEKGGEAPSI